MLRRLAHPVEGDLAAGPLSVIVAPVRALLQPIVHGLGDLEPVRLRAGDDADLDGVVARPGGATATTGSTWWRSGARSPSAAGCSTCSRRPRSTRCGWSSGATRSRRSAGSRWPTSARWRSAEDGLFAPPCRELLLTDEVRRAGARAGRGAPGAGRGARPARRGRRRWRAWRRSRRCWPGRWTCCSTTCPARPAVFVCDPERIRGRAEELVRTCQEFLEASWINAAAGGEAPIDLGAAAFRTLEEIRDHARRAGAAVVVDGAVRRRRWRGARTRRTSEAYRGDTERALDRHQGLARGGQGRRAAQRGPRPGRADGRAAQGRGRARPAGERSRPGAGAAGSSTSPPV